MGLTKRKQLFVAEFLANPGKPAAWAAVRAGYKEKRAKQTACELLKDPEIKAAIEQKKTGKLEKVEVSEKLVITGLLRQIQRCTEAGSGAWQVANAIKAYELLGRHLKMFTDKVEIGFDEELAKILEAGRKRAALRTLEAPQK